MKKTRSVSFYPNAIFLFFVIIFMLIPLIEKWLISGKVSFDFPRYIFPLSIIFLMYYFLSWVVVSVYYLLSEIVGNWTESRIDKHIFTSLSLFLLSFFILLVMCFEMTKTLNPIPFLLILLSDLESTFFVAKMLFASFMIGLLHIKFGEV